MIADTKMLQRLYKEYLQIKPIAIKREELDGMLDVINKNKCSLELENDEELKNAFLQENSFLTQKAITTSKTINELLLANHIDKEIGVRLEITSASADASAAIRKLFNTYLKFIVDNQYEKNVTESNNGIEIVVVAPNVYSIFSNESGIHAFTENGKTEYVRVVVLPLKKANEINIVDDEISVDYFHSSGAGGQNINKVETAIRITHIPTGTVVTCQDERSQKQNKEKALEKLKSKLQKIDNDNILEQEKKIRKKQTQNASIKNVVRSYDIKTGIIHDCRLSRDYEFNEIEKIMQDLLLIGGSTCSKKH